MYWNWLVVHIQGSLQVSYQYSAVLEPVHISQQYIRKDLQLMLKTIQYTPGLSHSSSPLLFQITLRTASSVYSSVCTVLEHFSQKASRAHQEKLVVHIHEQFTIPEWFQNWLMFSYKWPVIIENVRLGQQWKDRPLERWASCKDEPHLID